MLSEEVRALTGCESCCTHPGGDRCVGCDVQEVVSRVAKMEAVVRELGHQIVFDTYQTNGPLRIANVCESLILRAREVMR